MDNQTRIDALLDTVQSPARYIGGEMNAAAKPWEAAAVRFAFCFPDLYEVGMSHLGMKILYEIINAREDALCERVFAPAPDMADAMREQQLPLFSLESRRPVRDFDVVGFTLQYEMCYTTILEMLDLAGIALLSADRGEQTPVVVAGGPCAFNPEPLHAFIDAFSIGDGEDCLPQMLDAIRLSKEAGEDREACLLRLARIEGVYVPAFYDAAYETDGRLASFTPNREGVPARVRKCIVRDLDAAPYPMRMIVPFQEIVHDRIMLEVMRGCTRGCRFCQAGMLYRPVRERSLQTLVRLAQTLETNTGYEEISLSSLSTGDYSCLPELAGELMRTFEGKRVSLALPSLRMDGELSDSLQQTQKVRKSSLTFALEAGTQRLRDVINKGITESDLVRTVTDAFANGYSSLKLYFMIGLPTETEQDVLGIAEVVRGIVAQYFALPKGTRPRGLRVTVSASPFVPKPFTPFQWAAQDTMAQFDEKQEQLWQALRPIKGVQYRKQRTELSFLEACFARGDRRLADVLLAAFRLGCRFDSWTEHFRFDAWMQAFEACGIDPAFYANREREHGELFPWSFIDAGVTESFLWRERERAEGAQTTPDCRMQCNGCGLQEVCGV